MASRVLLLLLMSLACPGLANPMFEPKPLVETRVNPVAVRAIAGDTSRWFADFDKAAFGTVEFVATSPEDDRVVTVHLGEVVAKSGDRINRKPGGSRRYRAIKVTLEAGTHRYRVAVTPDKRNTGGRAVLMPPEIGEVMPFRYAEFEGLPEPPRREDLVQVRVHYPFDDRAAHFACSDPVLNNVWELCKYSMKATSFTGIYIDGDRERIPYEGDAYINQLGHYCVDTEYAVGRETLKYFLKHPTWPVEWHQHVPMMCWEEYLYTGDLSFVEKHYEQIAAKLLQPLAREDGLLEVNKQRATPAFFDSIGVQNARMRRFFRTLVDWPQTERDGHQIKPVDAVVNAFYHRNLKLMSRMARDAGRESDAERFERDAQRVFDRYQEVFWMPERGIYRDGEGTDHASLHANYFPLVSGLVPPDRLESVLAYIRKKGMATSVYGAQHLVDGLFLNGAAEYGLELLASTDERSWAHMIYGVGSTISLEAWDNKFKPNQDWNHAWGAAPANLIPRRLMGITPAEPGFTKARIQPQTGRLDHAEIRHPTRLGPIELEVRREGDRKRYRLSLPPGMAAEVWLEGDGEPRRVSAADTRESHEFTD